MPYPPHVPNPLFFLDYDGTLAPIVDDPMQAVPHPAAGPVLDVLAARYPLWIITGRHLRDLGVLLNKPLRAVGLHGTQEGTIGGEVGTLLPAATVADLARMRAALPEVEGVHVEDKDPSFAVHYRHAPDETRVKATLERWLQDKPDGLAVIWGKKVLELRPAAMSKGTAVAHLAAEHPDRTPLYLGDDVTDEDAFRALSDEAVTIKVGPGETAARYRLPDVDAAVAYLRGYVGM